MTTPELDLATILRRHGPEFLDRYGATLTPEQRRALFDLVQCRTAALGGHLEQCDQCGHQRIAYNSCRNRHCPKCQGTQAAQWMADRAAELLPVEYFHVVFTLPAALAPLALANPRVVYDILMRASAATLEQIAADPKHLGAQIGVLAVLHTWGQDLHHHPHVHCVVPGGGLSPDGTRWIACRPGFFLPVRILSRVFRGKVLSLLQAAYARGELVFPGTLGEWATAAAFADRLARSAATDWVVYAKPPFGGPDQVLKYLARYTHRVAITDRRLVSLEAGQVQFQMKDYAQGNRTQIRTLDAVEFLRRFLQHVLPLGFVRIRHYGLLANRHRHVKLALCRALLAAAGFLSTVAAELASTPTAHAGESGRVVPCPVCGLGRMLIVLEWPRIGGPVGEEPISVATAWDTS